MLSARMVVVTLREKWEHQEHEKALTGLGTILYRTVTLHLTSHHHNSYTSRATRRPGDYEIVFESIAFVLCVGF